MKRNREHATKHVLGVEGEWADHPRDPGGKTMLGVTIRTFNRAKKRGIIPSHQALHTLTPRQATAIYIQMYWQAVQGDALPDGLDLLVFDVQVNSGAGGVRLQRSLNHLYRAGLRVDNAIGPATINTLNKILDRDKDSVYKIMSEVAARRGLHWTTLTAIWGDFKWGWLRRGAWTLVSATRLADKYNTGVKTHG